MDSHAKRKCSPMSPEFMKPADVFRLSKRKRLSQSPSKISPLKNYSPLKCLQNCQNFNQESPKRPFQPFRQRRSPKASKIRNSFPIVKKWSPKKSPKGKGKRKLNFHTITDNNNVLNIDENANIESATDAEECPPITDPKQLLIDWTLKTRMRFVSTKSFGFRGNFRANEESAGITGFVRCLNNRDSMSPTSYSSSRLSQDSMDTSFASQLYKQSMVWSHPSLPWLTLFPRAQNPKPGTPVPSKAPTFSIPPNTPLAEALHTDWCKSLKSLYQLVKAMHCPYFYVCANGFTALFRAAGVANCDEIHVLVTPTTSGLRKLLADEGISFTLPFHNKSEVLEESTSGFVSLNSTPVKPDSADIGKTDDNECDNEEANAWLESLGLSQQDFPSLQSKKKTKTSQNAVSKMKSLVLIKGMSSTQLLINFLVNTPLCIANSGPLSGVPPTLLSPVAFHGSSLQSLQVKQTLTELQGNESFNCLELIGPILPNCIDGLTSLLKSSLGSFRASFTTYEPTAAFSGVTVALETNPSSKAFAVENLKDCGLDKQFLNTICSNNCRSNEPIFSLVAKDSIVSYNKPH